MLQSRVLKLIHIVSSLLLLWVLLGKSYAQTTLLPGDLLVVTANTSVNEFELIPLIDLEAGTQLRLSGAGEKSSFEPVTIIIEQTVTRGQRVSVSNEENDLISLSAPIQVDLETGMIMFSQPDEGINRLLFGITWGNYESDLINAFANYPSVPMLRFDERGHYQYHLKNGASGTTNMLAKMVGNPANWKSSTTPYSSFQTSLRILNGPVIVFDQNISTVSESDSIRLNVAIYEHDGSKLTVDAKFHHEYSTADTNDVNQFKKYTFNFTGLIGDAVYEKVVPITDDSFFEDRETAFFELENLSSGQFGDFISHAAFILDNEIPDVQITANQEKDFKLPILSITNNERVYLNINDWQIKIDELVIPLAELIEIAPYENQQVILDDFVTQQMLESLRKPSLNTLQILDREGQLIDELSLSKSNDIAQSKPAKIKRNNNDISQDVGASSELTIESGVVNQINSEAFESNKSDSISTPIKGWSPFTGELTDTFSSDVHFWDPYSQSFRIVNSANQDSISGKGLFHFVDHSIDNMNDWEVLKDSSNSIQPEVSSTQSDWVISITALDRNENSVIDGLEGLNLLQNSSGAEISVQNLLTAITEQIGEGKVSPYVFDLNFQQLAVYEENTLIKPNELFWMLADSILPQTDIVISPEQLNNSITEFELPVEPVSTLELSLQSEIDIKTTQISLFDAETVIKKSVPNPSISFSESDILNNGLQFALQAEQRWISSLNLGYTSDVMYSIPLGVRDTVSGKMTLEITDWNLEGGWQLFIEDLEMEEQLELLPGVAFNFEYFANDELNNEPENQSQINQRYRLLMVPPGVELQDESIPEQIELFQNYPNPFNPATTISFYLPEPVEVSLSVFNVVGQPVTTLTKGVLNAGEHHFEWNATGYPSGMYIYQLEVGTKVLTRKMTLVK
ncbi:MAG: T9SS type A sorting domain-containing protein [Balneolaceae bacterium]|nr:T9SS type A sorting domain-containing protein [Balneolaceae bacterium]